MFLFFQRMLAHYRLGLFRALYQRKGDLLVVHGQPPDVPNQYGGAIRNATEDLGFPRVMVRNHWWRAETLIWQDFFATMRTRPKAVILEESPRIISNYPLAAYCRLHGIPVIGFGHGRSMQRALNAGGLPNRLRRWQIRLFDGYIAYSPSGKAEVAALLGEERVFVAQNTLDTDELTRARVAAEQQPVAVTKQRLGLKSRYILLFSGRLHPDKEPITIIRLAERLNAAGYETGVVFLGEGPERNTLEREAARLAPLEVHFVGENNDLWATAPYFVAADAMVIPRWLGLAINHAFAMGLPVLTQEAAPGSPPHPPEVEALEPGRTGFIAPSNDLDALTGAAAAIFADREGFRARTIRKVETDLSLSRWVDGVTEAIAAMSHLRV